MADFPGHLRHLGRNYNLRKHQGCQCLRSDPMKANPPCPNVRIYWSSLSSVVWQTFVECITGFEALELAVKDKRHAWKAQKATMERQVAALQEQIE